MSDNAFQFGLILLICMFVIIFYGNPDIHDIFIRYLVDNVLELKNE